MHTSISKWLGITEQQLEIIKAVQKLQLNNEKTTPKRIEEQYKKTTGKHIQKPNLFNQLRTLVEKGILSRTDSAEYIISYNNIKYEILKTKQILSDEIKEIEKANLDIESFMRKISSTPLRPILRYYNESEFYDELAKLIQSADAFYCTTKFPAVTFASIINEGGWDYYKVLYKRAIIDKDLEVFYLTDFTVKNLLHFVKMLRKKDAARPIVTRLSNVLKECPNIHINYVPNMYGMDIAMPEQGFPKTFFVMIRDSDMYTTGGLYIDSPEIATDVKGLFLRNFEKGKPVTSRVLSSVMGLIG
ncbi:MAG: hypothetical protein J7K68_06215 [Candidatus Diapherotrites archaeon]|nr:hypothetical protein [Candidatus Diapherotrites archaeon]